jgi:hypothetical protein
MSISNCELRSPQNKKRKRFARGLKIVFFWFLEREASLRPLEILYESKLNDKFNILQYDFSDLQQQKAQNRIALNERRTLTWVNRHALFPIPDPQFRTRFG